jgi:uncharacterized protein YndB with AHSA1/START domain
MDGTLLREGDLYVLRFERHFPHAMERVWRTVSEPAELATWFPAEVEIELAVDGSVRFTHLGLDVHPELLPTNGIVTDLDPPRMLAFSWGDDLLRFELSAEAEGCVLVFTHHFANRASAPRSGAGWNVCLGSLRAVLDDTTAVDTDWRRHFERYVSEIGSDGILARDGETAELRFERLLDHPATEVWDALTRPERLSDWLAEASIEATEGRSVEMHFMNPVGYSVTGIVKRAEAPKVLEYTWTSPGEPDGVVKWQLIPVGDSCILLLTHTLQGHWNEAGTLAAWHVHLSLLASSLAGAVTWPFPDGLWEELQERYADTIGAESGKVGE